MSEVVESDAVVEKVVDKRSTVVRSMSAGLQIIKSSNLLGITDAVVKWELS